VRLRVAAPFAALAGAVAAAGILLVLPTENGTPGGEVMPAASPTTAEAPLGGVSVDHPPPPSLPVGAVAAGYGASRTGPAGVPVAFTRSADGAAAAATAWLATVEGSGILDAQRRPVVLDAIGDPPFISAAAARLNDRVAALGLPASGRPGSGYVTATVWADRGAYRVVSYGGGTARVEIWHLYQVGLVPPGGQPAPGRWRRAVVPLRWDGAAGDWRLTADFRLTEGPDPRVAAPSRLERASMLARLGDGWRLYANTQE